MKDADVGKKLLELEAAVDAAADEFAKSGRQTRKLVILLARARTKCIELIVGIEGS